MYKITNNINQLTEINNAVKIIENNQDSQYAEFDYNVINTKYNIFKYKIE